MTIRIWTRLFVEQVALGPLEAMEVFDCLHYRAILNVLVI
jgi:hypothetical protein